METIKISVGYGVAKLVAARVRADKVALGEALAERREGRDRMSAAEAVAARVVDNEWRARMRAEGRYLDTRGALVAWGAARALAARGWDREWPAAPAEARGQARWPGSQDRGVPEHISAQVPHALAEQVLAACWWTSAEAIAEIRRWRERHPDVLARGVPLTTEPKGLYLEYEVLAARVTTTGDLWRQAVRIGLDR